MDDTELKLLYVDAHLVAVAKPAGLAVHPSRLCNDRDSLLARVRRAVGAQVYPVHRLDRATSGVVVFGATSAAAAVLADNLRSQRLTKRYLAIVRGHLRDAGVIDKPLPNRGDGALVAAMTRWRALSQTEQPWPVRPYATARYTLVELEPVTGRTHQLRKHMRALAHPIIGDRMLGDGAHNREFAAHTQVHRLLLHAWQLDLPHPATGLPLALTAPLDLPLATALRLFPNVDLPEGLKSGMSCSN